MYRNMWNTIVIICLCGSSVWAFGVDPRIINGDRAQNGQFPYTAALIMDGSSFCGGSLIDKKWILTAAHCLDGAKEVSVSLGIVDRLTSNVNIKSTNFTLHPGYKFPNNDIALIKLPQAVNFTGFIKPVDFLPYETLPSARQVTAIGWGRTADNSSVSVNLNYVNVSTITGEKCAQTYGNTTLSYNIVCTEGVNRKGICQGDSGGPLVEITDVGKHVLVGVSCFTHINGCLVDDLSGFTRTFEYKGWIHETINEGMKLNISILSVIICFIMLIIANK